MADNFVRKTISKKCELPNISYYDVGDLFMCGNSVYIARSNGAKKIWSELAQISRVAILESKVKALETTVADHEARIKVLEATP